MGRDIIIHYDETAGKIVCSTVEHSLTRKLLSESLPLETEVDALRAKNVDEAERTFGAAILALLDLSSHTKIGIRDYSVDTDDWDAEHTDELEQKSAAGDMTAQYELAMQFIAEGLSEKSKQKMDRAEALLLRAVASGNTEAEEYFSNLWPALKDRSDRNFI